MSTLRAIEDILHTTPHLVESFVAHFEYSEEQATPVRKQGGDGFEKKLVRYSEFRVRLRTDKSFADRTKSTLGEALVEAFQTIGLPLPEKIAAWVAKHEGHE